MWRWLRILATRVSRRLSLTLASVLLPVGAAAQGVAPADTTRVYELESVVVTADRSASSLASSTAAVSVLRESELERLPVRTLAGALEQTPGLAFLTLDGLGYDPQATVRGFYGGGEAEYVVVLIDGRPLNNLEGGLVNWNQVPLAGIAAVEVMRGGASSLYGDAAIGGVINLVTKPAARRAHRLWVSGGSHGTFTGRASVSADWDARPVSVFGDVLRTDAYRDHAERFNGTLGASVGFVHTPRRWLALSTLQHWRDYDVPGPLTTAELEEDRTQRAPFYRFDRNEERTHRLALDATAALGEGGELAATLTGELRRADIVRTLPLAPGFADTRNRVIRAARLLGTVQASFGPLLANDRLTLGVDASHGSLDSEYYAVVSGDPTAYRSATGERGRLDTKGTTRRTAAASFIQYDLRPVPGVRLSVGARLDRLRDTFDPEAPGEGPVENATHTAFSPKAGVNVRYARSGGHAGNVYANVSRSFKAPTLDQLFDQRRIPVPFPPFSVSISNAALEPQTGTSIEAGLYHQVELARALLAGELSLAVYQIDMKDELDFDVQQFKSVNIGESRHRGIESGLKLFVGSGLTAFFNYTLQDVTFRKGENEGNQLKAIPKHHIGAGVTASHPVGLSGTLTVTNARRIYLDDANTIRLPDYTTAGGRLAYARRPVTLSLEVFNLLDETYSTTGFPDPAGTGVVYFYPAAGRTVRLGLGVTR